MHDIMEKARELGFALAETQEYQRMLSAQMAVRSNDPLSALLAEFTAKRSALMETLSDADFDNMLAMNLSADIERLQEQMMENLLFTDMLEAEKTFSALLTTVDGEINACIGGAKSGANCAGDCSGCSGCKH